MQNPLSVAVIGSGVSGLSAAWLLSQSHRGETHRVTLYEKDDRLGGHCNTIDAPTAQECTPVDTGFIVYNETNYPNLTALFAALGVATRPSPMSFAVSLRGGAIEYSSNGWGPFIGFGRNLLSPRFWSMGLDLLRFYHRAAKEIDLSPDAEIVTLGDYLDRRRYSEAFQRDHLLPEAAAIWSTSVKDIRAYPACAFIRFFENHGLFRFTGRPQWRTVIGGSQAYVRKLRAGLRGEVLLNCPVKSVRSLPDGVEIRDASGRTRRYDRVLIAAHSDQALAMLDAPDPDQRALLSAIRYGTNHAVLHTDPSLMPRRAHAWSSWNYVGDGKRQGCAVTYWMNRLQNLHTDQPLFVTLNPARRPAPAHIIWEGDYEHPCFTPEALRAQRRLWTIQGRGAIWFAGAWFGAGFHEDGLQAGLAAAEAMGAMRRPWSVPDESGRIVLAPPTPHEMAA
ncbi:MAG: FAD-dependent oxidoreductase [Hyphomonadaceae bacterium]|nr:FAD-dependent oxidoreductase [Hyphomonadaceae bacterium]